MAVEAEANREARAKILEAQGEQNASVALQKAAEILTESPTAIQVYFRKKLYYTKNYWFTIYNYFIIIILLLSYYLKLFYNDLLLKIIL